MKRVIYLYGHLKKLHPEPIVIEAPTVASAIRHLQRIPALKPKDGRPWPIVIDGVDDELALFGQSDMEEIHVRPRLSGAGGGGSSTFLQIVVGIALIALAIINPGALLSATAALAVGMFGASLVLGGLMQLLMPVPTIDFGKGVEESRYLPANSNTVKIGTRIPMIYGTRRWGGHYLSFDVDARDSDPLTGQITGIKLASPNSVQFDEDDPYEWTDTGYFRHVDAVIPMTKEDYPVLPIFSVATPGPLNLPIEGYEP